MKLPSHDRYDYVPITKRPVYDWPEGKRLAVFLCSNIEHFAYRAGLGVDASGGDRPQSQQNYAWRDYGNRVGIWSFSGHRTSDGIWLSILRSTADPLLTLSRVGSITHGCQPGSMS